MTMEATYSNEKFDETVDDKFEAVVNAYLSILDHQQNEIYNVRMMHHEVWRDVHQVTGISETRAGSRVERYTKILPIGSKSDVDYKLCVQGVEIDMQQDGMLYLVPCPSKAYCKLFITANGKAMVEENPLLSKLFRFSVFKCPESEGFMVKPAILKTNVVEHCKFEMREDSDQRSPSSPAVSGEGALNPYDIVPCLKLRVWPDFMRKKVLDMYQFSSRNSEPSPVFIVPTGYPLSQSRDLEWRLSFAVLEIEIFRQLKSHQRRLYGLAKYLFKVVFEKLELIQSYHLKILFLLKLEDDDLVQIKLLPFLAQFFKYVLDAIEKQYIPHLFIEDCNIFPVHYYTDMKKEQFRLKVENDNFKTVMRNQIKEIISHDTRTNIAEHGLWLVNTKQTLENRQETGLSPVWVSGYLTRLLSVIAYCLQKSQAQNKLYKAVKNLLKLIHADHQDKYINRVTPLIRCLLKDVYHMDLFSDFETESVRPCDKASYVLHRAFYCYERNDIENASHYLTEAESTDMNTENVGVTVTKFHNGIDKPLDFVIGYCKEKLNANRFYLCPNIIRLHINIQLRVRKIEALMQEKLSGNSNKNPVISQKSNPDVQNYVTTKEIFDGEIHQIANDIALLVTEMENAANVASIREPYTGKLSYKHASFLLLLGYKEQFSRSAHRVLRDIPIVFDQDCSTLYDKKEQATNFDLR